MHFKTTFCDPFKPDIIEIGDIAAENLIEIWESIQWNEYLQRMETAKENEIYYSPSLEFENKENKNSLSISAVGKYDNYEFYVFYKRPKKVKIFFGLTEKMDENYVTEITGQTINNVLDFVNALMRGDTEYLASKIGQ